MIVVVVGLEQEQPRRRRRSCCRVLVFSFLSGIAGRWLVVVGGGGEGEGRVGRAWGDGTGSRPRSWMRVGRRMRMRLLRSTARSSRSMAGPG